MLNRRCFNGSVLALGLGSLVSLEGNFNQLETKETDEDRKIRDSNFIFEKCVRLISVEDDCISYMNNNIFIPLHLKYNREDTNVIKRKTFKEIFDVYIRQCIITAASDKTYKCIDDTTTTPVQLIPEDIDFLNKYLNIPCRYGFVWITPNKNTCVIPVNMKKKIFGVSVDNRKNNYCLDVRV